MKPNQVRSQYLSALQGPNSHCRHETIITASIYLSIYRVTLPFWTKSENGIIRLGLPKKDVQIKILYAWELIMMQMKVGPFLGLQ
jgi:hypothetical protein